MRSDENSTNIPEEVERWFKENLIEEAQYKRIRERYTSNIWDSIEYFFEMGLINEDQYDKLRMKYVPEEIENWYEEGIITRSQLETFRQGYRKNIEDVLVDLERNGDLEFEQRSKIGSLYGADQIPIDQGYIQIEEPVPEFVPLMDEPEEKELWPDDFDYETEPGKFIEQKPEPEKKEKKAPEIEASLSSKRRTMVKREPVREDVKKETFFKFNQLVFFITGTILFLLGVFAAVVYSWEYISNIGRGMGFMVLSTMVLISGIILRQRKFNKYLEVLTYHASFILFSVGIIFLISGSMGDRAMLYGVILLSLLIPMMATFVGFHFRYYSISVLAGLGYIVAVIYSTIQWPEGSMITNSFLLILASLILVITRLGMGSTRKTGLPDWTSRYRGELLEGRIFSYSMIAISIISFLVSQSILVLDNDPGSLIGSLLSVSGLIVLFSLFWITVYDRIPGIKILAYFALVLDAFLQFGLINDLGLSAGCVAGLSIAVPFFFCSIIWTYVKAPVKDDLVVHQVIQWSSMIGICFLILGTEPVMSLDIQTHYALLIGVFALLSIAITMYVKNSGIFVFSLFIFACTTTYFGIMKFDLSHFAILLVPFIFNIYFRKEDDRKHFEAPFILFLVINFVLMWVNTIEPFSGFETLIEPLSEWWKGIITLLFSFFVFFRGLNTGKRNRFWIGSLMFIFSTWMAMMGQGDLFVIVFFLLTSGPIFLRRSSLISKEKDLSGSEEDMFQNGMLVAGSILFISIWFSPVFSPVKETSLDWSWWKTLISVVFSILYLSWSVASLRKLHFIAGSLFMATAALFNTFYRSEFFALVLILLPVLLIILRRSDRIKENISRSHVQIYMFIYSLIALVAFVMVLAIKPYDPILKIVSDSPKEYMWFKSTISFFFTLTVLGFGIFYRSKYYYLLGTALFTANCIILSLFYSEFFTLPVLLIPVLLFLIEKQRGILGIPRSIGVYLVRMQYIYSMLIGGMKPNKDEKLKELPAFWLYRHLFPLFLIPIAIALFFKPVYPMFDIPIDTIYIKYLIAMILALPVLIQSGRSELPLPAMISTIILVSWTVMVSLSKLELLSFLMIIFPVIIHLSRPRSSKVSDFQRLYHIFYNLPILLGYLILWLIPLDPVIDQGLWTSDHLLFKGGTTLVFGFLVLVWGYLFEKRSSLVVGIALTSISLLFLSLVFFEPLVFVFMLIIPSIKWLSKGSGILPRSERMYGLIKKITPFNNLFVIIGFSLLFAPSIFPVIEVSNYSQLFWIYRGIIMIVYSGSILGFAMFRNGDRLTVLMGMILCSVTILFLSATLLSEIVFLFFLLLHLVFSWKKREANGMESRVISTIAYHGLMIPVIGGFLILWLDPFRSIYHLQVYSNGFWMMKSFLATIFSIGCFSWGVHRREISTTLVSLILITITILVFGTTTLSIGLVAIAGVIHLISYAKQKIEWTPRIADIPNPFNIFQNLYLMVVLLSFFLIWIPESYPLMTLEPWSTEHFLFRALLATVFTGILMILNVYLDQPYPFLLSNLLIILISFIMVIAVSEPFALMIYLVPLSLFLSQAIVFRKGFERVSVAVFTFFRTMKGRAEDPESLPHPTLIGVFKHLTLMISVFFFIILFIMVWTGPAKPLFDLQGTDHLWFISGTMFVFAIIPLFWGLKGILRAHVLTGVLFIVIDGWIIFLAQMEGLGVVVSLFFTAIMFIAGGLYFVWASKKQGSDRPT